jgi:hypothetical protein
LQHGGQEVSLPLSLQLWFLNPKAGHIDLVVTNLQNTTCSDMCNTTAPSMSQLTTITDRIDLYQHVRVKSRCLQSPVLKLVVCVSITDVIGAS